MGFELVLLWDVCVASRCLTMCITVPARGLVSVFEGHQLCTQQPVPGCDQHPNYYAVLLCAHAFPLPPLLTPVPSNVAFFFQREFVPISFFQQHVGCPGQRRVPALPSPLRPG